MKISVHRIGTESRNVRRILGIVCTLAVIWPTKTFLEQNVISDVLQLIIINENLNEHKL